MRSPARSLHLTAAAAPGNPPLTAQPRSHTIIEAHPDVYKYACSQGWDKKPGVRLVQGRWQDVIDQVSAACVPMCPMQNALPPVCSESCTAAGRLLSGLTTTELQAACGAGSCCSWGPLTAFSLIRMANTTRQAWQQPLSVAAAIERSSSHCT